MNKLYIQRRIGRGHVEVINDSAAISITDLFWIKRPHLNFTWDSLQSNRDISEVVNKATLDGVLNAEAWKNPKTDYTSNFITKGTFRKSIYKNYLIKKGDNAEYEISGYNIAKHLGISCARAISVGEEVHCELFTSEEISMAHALEILYDFDTETYSDIYSRAIDFVKDKPIIANNLKKLYLLMYLCSNFDFHGENFGFLYNTSDFEIIGVAPAFDFNSAFECWNDTTIYYEEIMELLPEIINNNLDLVAPLKSIDTVLEEDIHLSKEAKNEVTSRAIYLVGLVNNVTTTCYFRKQ